MKLLFIFTTYIITFICLILVAHSDYQSSDAHSDSASDSDNDNLINDPDVDLSDDDSVAKTKIVPSVTLLY